MTNIGKVRDSIFHITDKGRTSARQDHQLVETIKNLGRRLMNGTNNNKTFFLEDTNKNLSAIEDSFCN